MKVSIGPKGWIQGLSTATGNVASHVSVILAAAPSQGAADQAQHRVILVAQDVASEVLIHHDEKQGVGMI
eukprot:4335471-Pyramimonas_sp.AAC.1